MVAPTTLSPPLLKMRDELSGNLGTSRSPRFHKRRPGKKSGRTVGANVCEFCGKEQARKTDMPRHLYTACESFVPPGGRPTFSCSACSASLSRRDALKRHQRKCSKFQEMIASKRRQKTRRGLQDSGSPSKHHRMRRKNKDFIPSEKAKHLECRKSRALRS